MRSRAIMMQYIGSALLAFCGFLTVYDVATAAESEVPKPFQRFDDTSRYTINYDDLSDLLGRVVVDVGKSRRVITDPPQAMTGTRMKTKVKRFTGDEGNRFFYETFTDNEAAQQYLRDIQNSLQQLPSETPLEKFSRDEQLAYWLNLYNVTVLNEIVAVYPIRSLQRLLQGKNSILSKKLLTVAGISLSLDDIQFTILKQNYDNDPLIMYGLYQGIVGGPNIRRSAYTGDDVYRALEDNAFEFINSNRGTFSNDESTFLVSSLYNRNRAYFPRFDSELSQHLLNYLEGDVRIRLEAANTLAPVINDWTVTDLGGTQQEVGGSFAYNPAALLDAVKGRRRADGGVMVAPVEVKRAKEVSKEETVTIEDIGDSPAGRGALPEEITTGETVPTE